MLDLKSGIKFIKSRDYRDGNGTFQVAFLKCNRTKKIGGEYVSLENACHCGLPPNCQDHEMIGIMDMDTGKKFAVHIRLLFDLNKQPIYWI